MNTNQITEGAIVKYSNPESEEEANVRLVVIEDNGNRVLAEYICDMPIRPTFVYSKSDIVLA